MRRVVTPELLDSDAGTAQEIASALADLRLVNRCFGGLRTSRRMLSAVAAATRREALSVLDVACGSGDTTLHAAHDLTGEGVRLDVTLLDRAISHLPRNGTRRVVADALRIPFADQSFDVVSCALFAHHLEPDQVIQFVDESLRVCREAVLINDLRRHSLHLALVYAGRPLFRSRMAWADGIASVRRAYTMAEASGLLRRTHAARVDLEPRFLYRFAAIAWKH